MNIQQGFALRSRPDTNKALRWWTALTRTTFFSVILLSDVLAIVVMACTTGVAYHLAVYGETGDVLSFLEVGTLAATIFVCANLFRGEYVLANFFSFKPHLRRSIQLWNVDFKPASESSRVDLDTAVGRRAVTCFGRDGRTRPRSRLARATTSAPYCAVRKSMLCPRSSIGRPLL